MCRRSHDRPPLGSWSPSLSRPGGQARPCAVWPRSRGATSVGSVVDRRSGELVLAVGAEDVHLARYFVAEARDLVLFPLCGTTGSLAVVESGQIDCKRCRQAGASVFERTS